MGFISIEAKKFGQLEIILTAPDTGLILVHDGSGVKTITVANLKSDLKSLVDANSEKFTALNAHGAGAHNSIYRGKYLGNSYTAEQQAAVAEGTFDDLYIGDYWMINSVTYRIAGFDYFYNCGDTACTAHHMIVVPDKCLYTHVMNDINTTEGGYFNSKMHTSGLDSAKATAAAAFGSEHILSYREDLTNAVTTVMVRSVFWSECISLQERKLVRICAQRWT